MFSAVLPLVFHLGFIGVQAQVYPTFSPSSLPNQWQPGQAGTNQCGTGSNQTSLCQNAYINSVNDFCVYAPPDPGPNSVIGNTEREEVSWCILPGYGTRLIPPGTITGAHFVQTPDYVQVTGVGDLTKLNIPAGDAGGELDPHGADGNGNPIGGLVFSSAFSGQLEQVHEWTNFVAADQFCFRACKDSGSNAAALCNHIYDTQGCAFNIPGNYGTGFDTCQGDTDQPMGAGTNAAPTSNCKTSSTIGPTSTTTSAPATATPTNAAANKSGTSSGARASNTSSPNSALAVRLPSSGSVFTIVGIVLGAFLF